MKDISDRLIIYPKDAMRLTGKGLRTCRHMIARIKKKKSIPFVDVEAFCEHTGLKEKAVLAYLANN